MSNIKLNLKIDTETGKYNIELENPEKVTIDVIRDFVNQIMDDLENKTYVKSSVDNEDEEDAEVYH